MTREKWEPNPSFDALSERVMARCEKVAPFGGITSWSWRFVIEQTVAELGDA